MNIFFRLLQIIKGRNLEKQMFNEIYKQEYQDAKAKYLKQKAIDDAKKEVFG